MTLPNFLVVGATRSGTTSLHYYFQQHPQVFISPLKSTNFFLFLAQPDLATAPETADPRRRFPVRSLDEYQALFRGVHGHSAVGEVSPEYLARDGVAQEIQKHLPEARIIAILRNPVERAFASYLMQVSYGRENRSFDEVLDDEARQNVNPVDSRYLKGGFYALYIKPYIEHFDLERVAVFLHEELCADATGMMRRMFRFLDVDENVAIDTSVRFNSWGRPTGWWAQLLQHLIKKRRATQALQRRLPPAFTAAAARWLAGRGNRGVVKPRISDEAWARLSGIYRDDILALSTMLDRELTHWLEPMMRPQSR
ncbi:MAG TPA: sulfotransferase [Gammaproteobacteria bacterium]|nr:sulfotransferase [Gammaproteobacteria bacterium]